MSKHKQVADRFSGIPHALKERQSWVCWRMETRDGKPTKVPYNPITGKRAKSNDGSTWTDFHTACHNVSRFDGLGVMFDGELAGVDLDKCRNPETGRVETWAEEIVQALDSYTEISPSGTGLHIFVQAVLPAGRRRKGQIEMYGAGSPRYFTVTGQHLSSTPATVELRQAELDALHRRVFPVTAPVPQCSMQQSPERAQLPDSELLAKARSTKNGDEFDRLWKGGYPEDDSGGDLSLCNHLAFWTGGDAARMDSLFRMSGRMRPKWDEKRGTETYGELTIRKALEVTTDVCTCRKRKAKTSWGAGDDKQVVQAIGGVVSTDRIAAAILKTEHFAVDEGMGLYVYEHGCYRPRGERRIKTRVKRLLENWGLTDKWTSHRQQEVVEYIRVDRPALWPIPPMDMINCTNGLLDLGVSKLLPHSPEFLSPVQLPVAYDPGASCPAWFRFVNETFPEDAQALPWEIVAWLMTPDTSIQKAVLFLGEGANGKSTALAGITRFLGVENCATVSLHKLEADRFAVARLVGKLANVCPDLPSSHLTGTSVFKAITGGDRLDAERKYAESFAFDCYARLIFSANHPPRSLDSSDAFYRRWICVPFTRTFEGASARSRQELDAELADPHELSGVLNLALEALPRVTAQGIAEADSMRQAMRDFRTITDPLSVWLETALVHGPELVTAKRTIWTAYRETCAQAGRLIPTEAAFGRALRQALPDLQDAQRQIEGRTQWCWLGIGLRSGAG